MVVPARVPAPKGEAGGRVWMSMFDALKGP